MGNIEGAARDTGFTWYSTAEDTLGSNSLKGKTALITGTNVGLGRETARVLGKAGARVFVTCRSKEKCEETVSWLRKEVPSTQFDYIQLDLSSLNSVRAAAKDFKSKSNELHILVNNAGVMGTAYTETVDGFEVQFGTNHLGHFLLTNLLLDTLKASGTDSFYSRVVTVASSAHRFGQVNFDDLKGKDTWYSRISGPYRAYGQSKTANILFASELDQRMRKEGAKVLSVSLHPGSIMTELSRHSPLAVYVKPIANTFLKSIPQGAATTVYCCVSPDLQEKGLGGRYFSDSSLAKPLSYATDPENAKKLWEVSSQLVGLN